jgi:hypothetical protein
MTPYQTRTEITEVKLQNKNPRRMFSDFYICCSNLVGPTRENWNYLFEALVILCEQLEELDIEAIIDRAAS